MNSNRCTKLIIKKTYILQRNTDTIRMPILIVGKEK